ncbi:hypothetical protein [Microbacterium sp. SSM24]|uniref:hypothetical protein n=1 Tax=Microbacterium sp. SSM24 TaxID=2991714 RepID=UPI0022280AE9|nr:hypothetical protein [Microbacterium sp. SSM24]MCW3493177.1 hypothetical protein [Microbacterium sp. SSM24]
MTASGAPAPRPGKRPAFEPAARLLTPTGYDPDMRRPASIVAGTALVLLSVLAGCLVLVGVALTWDTLVAGPDVDLEGFEATPDGRTTGLIVVLAVAGATLVFDLVLAVFVYLGRNWARVIVMLFAVLRISTTFVAWWAQGQEITLGTTFISLAVDILLLLALSSRSAAAYARRNERPRVS